jgi:UDP-glucose 4-epimerase
MNVLITGGAGYIGSHAVLRLLEDGHRVTVVDDLSRGHAAAIDRLRPLGDLHFAEASVGDRAVVAPLMRDRDIDLVMHFAALAYVGESVERPLTYYRANTAGTLGLLEAMDDAGVTRLVFSSTCATYGEPDVIPIGEDCPQHPINPYGAAKLFGERMILDLAAQKRTAGADFSCAMLRYFNVAGSDGQGRIGEDHDPETHLVPICVDAALGRREALTIYGTDYDTPDGTCIRDYVHVEDLIDAHLIAIDGLAPGTVRAFNVGTGRGFSVREVIDATRRVTGVDLRVEEGARRPGDPPVLFADPRRINTELGWTARHTTLDPMIEAVWRWRREQPEGYGDRQ